MMDKFEKNIRDNIEFFDEQAPDRMKMWKHIESGIPPRTKAIKTPLWKKTAFRVAAGIIILIGVGLFLTQSLSNSKTLANAEPLELREVNSHYGRIVALQVLRLKASPDISNDEKQEFLTYIDELNKEQSVLKKELEKDLDNTIVLEAIIDNFNQQIKLIEQLLERLDHYNKINDEKGISI